MVARTEDSLGNIMWWGLTPAINLAKCLDTYCSGDHFDGKSSIFVKEYIHNLDTNILCVGMGDSRHILRTLSSKFSGKNKFETFYLIEPFHGTYARQMLQLYTALETYTRVGLQDKVEIYLEIFGNMMIRDVTSKYLINAANNLTRLVTNLGPLPSFTFFDLSHLKFKERDMLESTLKFWRGGDETKFDAVKCWDYRLRKHLGTRYDAIPNVFDWDCSITLHDRKVTQINSKEYAHWRQYGMAFELREANYNVPNRSLASGKVFRNSAGDKGVYWGYWGDIICSPYLVFGIDTSECCELNRLVNGKHAYAASTISEVNIRKMFWELENQKDCPLHISAPFLDPSTTNDDISLPDEKNDPTVENDSDDSKQNIDVENRNSDDYIFMKFPLDIANAFKVNFLPCNSFLDLPIRYRSLFLKSTDNNSSSSSLNKRFSIIYIGNSLVHLLSDLHKRECKKDNGSHLKSNDTLDEKECNDKLEDMKAKSNESTLENDLFNTDISSVSFTDLLEDEALLIVESILYIVEVRSEQIKAYCENVSQMAYDLGFESVKEIKPMEDHHLYFRFKRILQ
ncbi:hypothetical protein Smp_168710 [Schistosoma mansoni]|uniref:hypothetical protein n=1 Tax=Schistosoma mansoni TaxID=6183 RepID=UPI00022DC794|nr:hypothetical protein Smp_168710 [Schistosoma mansoni]|eukprot:XP_018653072.1 hypothetical protein Smp_168710 [Schistosoma mansoni]